MTAVASRSAGAQTTPVSFKIGLNIVLVAIYTNFALPFAGVLVAGALFPLGALFLLPHVRSSFRLGLLMAFLTFSLVAGGSGGQFFGVRLDSWLQIMFALCCAQVLLCAMKYPDTVRRTLFAWMIFITVGVTLERFLPPFSHLSDAVRAQLFQGRWLYDSLSRDLSSYGFLRPKLFTQEPSHPAKAFVAFGTGWCLLSTYHRRFALLLACTIPVVLFLGSPLTLAVVPLAWLLGRMAAGRGVSIALASALPLLGLTAWLLAQLFPTRWAGAMAGSDSSFFGRYLGPYEVAARTIAEFPIFGVGIGAKEALWENVYTTYAPMFLDRSWLLQKWMLILANGFANSLSFFGIVGSIVFYFLIAAWLKEFGVPAAASLSIVFVFFNLDGAFEGLRMWGYVAIVAGCYSMVAARGDPRGVAGGGLPGAPLSADTDHAPASTPAAGG